MMVEVSHPAATGSSDNPRRTTMNMESMSRALSGAGGEGTNQKFLTSFIALFIVVVVLFSIMSSSGGGGGTADPSSHGSLGGDSPASSYNNKFDPYTDYYNDFASHRQVQSRPQNVSLLIIGNATAHFSYLSLVYYLRWGRWFDPGLVKSNLVNEYSFDNPFHQHQFGEFHYQTNVLLEPYELCDCHKGEHTQKRMYIYENRYFHDPHHNNTVTYIHAYGDEVPLFGRLKPDDLFTNRWTWSNKEHGLMNPGYDKPSWRHDTWEEFVQNYAIHLSPKPEYAIMEAGGFDNTFGPQSEEKRSKANDLSKAFDDVNIHAFWRTKPYDKTHSMTTPLDQGDDKNAGLTEFDDYMCTKVMKDCINLEWTKEMDPKYYWDKHHFNEPVHRVFNEELLERMGKLPKDYVKYDKSLLLLEN